MKKYARPLIVLLAALALAASISSLYVHYRLLNDPSYTSFCDVSETVSCEAVITSRFGYMFGIPVAAGGAIWSALVLILAVVGMRPSAPVPAAAVTASAARESGRKSPASASNTAAKVEPDDRAGSYVLRCGVSVTGRPRARGESPCRPAGRCRTEPRSRNRCTHRARSRRRGSARPSRRASLAAAAVGPPR